MSAMLRPAPDAQPGAKQEEIKPAPVAAAESSDSKDTVASLGLEKYAFELDLNGVVIVPPEVTGLTPDRVDRMCELTLNSLYLNV